MRQLVALGVALLAVATAAPGAAVDLAKPASDYEPRHTMGGPQTKTCSGSGTSTCNNGNHAMNGPYAHGFAPGCCPRFTGQLESKVTGLLMGGEQTVTCNLANGQGNCFTNGAPPLGWVSHTCRGINGFGTWQCYVTHSGIPSQHFPSEVAALIARALCQAHPWLC